MAADLALAPDPEPNERRSDPDDSSVQLRAIVDRLQNEADQRVGQRRHIEDRWITDLEMYHGQYDRDTLTKLKAANKSTLFVNLTRAKTNAMEARLSDMLFPTDDRNWGIDPTPVPELSDQADEAARAAVAIREQAAQMPEGDPGAQQLLAQAERFEEVNRRLQAAVDEAKKRADAMQAEIDDQLRECRYNIAARDVIQDGCRIGTGVMKGPVVGSRTPHSWVHDTGANAYVLRPREQTQPVYHRVDPWGFFPDPDARTIEESESNFERHLMGAKALRRLAKEPGFDADAIRRLLRQDPDQALPQYLSDLRSIVGYEINLITGRYQVWEYHGPLSAEDMHALAQATGRDDLLEAAPEDDPLEELHATVWFSQGELLKLGIHPLDSGEALYSVWNLERDDSTIWGFGIPYIMRDQQRALAAAWRMMMDNAGLTTGPQIVVNHSAVEPADGDWQLAPNKLWYRKNGAPAGVPAFELHNIDSHQPELANIIELARRFIDEETAIPLIAQGDQSSHVTQTAHGMSILMNAANVVFRRVVKNWDDDMTRPNVRRLYHWNMQFSEQEHIKGDFEVDARGTSVLLVREIQSANLMTMVNAFAGHPVLGPLTKIPALYRRLVQSMMLPADEVVLTDEEIEQQQAQQQDARGQDPDVIRATAQLNAAQLKAETDLELAHVQRETALMELAAQHNIELDRLRAMLGAKEAERQSKERLFAAEAAITERTAASGGGWL